jgi:sodium transport system permease protein
MKNNILTVMSKEFARFFGDRRMIIMILLPAILIYVIYSFMGTALSSMYSPDEDFKPIAYAVGIPDQITREMQASGISILFIEANEADGIKEKIQKKEANLLLVFPPDFHEAMTGYDVQASKAPAPNIEVYYNSTVPNSADAYGQAIAALDAYESSLANKFDVNRDVFDSDQATSEDMSASIISSMMPMLLMIFLYSGCMGLAPESIAGEKERGTLATLLVTPLKRSELAAGKILSLAVLSFLSGIVTAAATILSLPNLMGGSGDLIDAGIYSARDYMFLVFIILSTILLLVTLISIVSAFAKTVKEANTAVMPLMILVMLVGVTGMFGKTQTDTVFYVIPLYSSVQSMGGVFSRNYSAINIAVSSISNLIFACVGGFVLTKMFNSEKVMFSK